MSLNVKITLMEEKFQTSVQRQRLPMSFLMISSGLQVRDCDSLNSYVFLSLFLVWVSHVYTGEVKDEVRVSLQ